MRQLPEILEVVKDLVKKERVLRDSITRTAMFHDDVKALILSFLYSPAQDADAQLPVSLRIAKNRERQDHDYGAYKLGLLAAAGQLSGEHREHAGV